MLVIKMRRELKKWLLGALFALGVLALFAAGLVSSLDAQMLQPGQRIPLERQHRGPFQPSPPPGPVPTNVVVSVITQTTARLTWTAVPGASGYMVYRGSVPVTSAPIPPLLPSQIKPGIPLFFTDKGLAPRTSYSWSVTAIYPDGRQGASAPVNGKTLPPVNPSGFQGRPTGADEITLSWNALPEASYYWLGGPGLGPERLPHTTTSHKVRGLNPGAHNYYIIAYYQSGGQHYADETNMSRASVILGGLLSGIDVQPKGLVASGQRITITVRGRGGCDRMRVMFAGQSFDLYDGDYNLESSSPITWKPGFYGGGIKEIHAVGVTGCSGRTSARVDLAPHQYERVIPGQAPKDSPVPYCGSISDKTVAAGSKIRITDLSGGTAKINFGGAVFGMGAPVLGIEGDSSQTPPDYPFPTMRKNSLVLRSVSGLFQGFSGAIFTLSTASWLQFCVNDKHPHDNSGSWKIGVEINEPPHSSAF